jgi:hypothetical protein
LGIVLIGVGVALFWYELRIRHGGHMRGFSAKKTYLTYDKTHLH